MKTEIDHTRAFLKQRLRRDWVTLRGHESESKNLQELLRRTTEIGESNSVLIIGPRGSGKSTVINAVLNSFLCDNELKNNSIIVHLNGVVHTDDRIALKASTTQMNLENAVEGKVFGSFSENLAFLLACLKAGNKKSKSVVFILEEFDLFCAHHNQTLLYNLFDISQSAQAPICVLGITCRLDVIELLEKRVKSRFSHRQVFIFPNSCDFNSRLEVIKNLLKLPSAKSVSKIDKITASFPDELSVFHNAFNYSEYTFSKTYAERWNRRIDALTSNPNVQEHLRNLCDLEINESFLKSFLFKLVSSLSDGTHEMISSDGLAHLSKQYQNDGKLFLICGLSVLEICIIISIKHHCEIYDRDPFNFEIIFARFSKFAKISSTMQGVERSVVLKAFEHLRNIEIFVPVSSTTIKIQKEFQMHKMCLTYGQINQAISKYQALPTEISQWAQSSLI